MNDFKRGCPCLLDCTVYSATLGAIFRLFRLVGNLAYDRGLSQGIVLDSLETRGEFSTVLLGEKDTRTILELSLLLL